MRMECSRYLPEKGEASPLVPCQLPLLQCCECPFAFAVQCLGLLLSPVDGIGPLELYLMSGNRPWWEWADFHHARFVGNEVWALRFQNFRRPRGHRPFGALQY